MINLEDILVDIISTSHWVVTLPECYGRRVSYERELTQIVLTSKLT